MTERDKLIGELDAYDAELNLTQQRAVRWASDIGAVRDDVRRVREGIALLPPSPLFADAAESIHNIRTYVHAHRDEMDQRIAELRPVLQVGTGTTSATAMAIVSSALDPELLVRVERALPPIQPWPRHWVEDLAARLSEHASDLGLLAISAWEQFHVGTTEGARASLSATRELFNQFFRTIAPDDEVRKSEYFSPKKDENPDKVHRSERLRYGAHRYVSDPTLRTVLIGREREILKTYDELIRVHAAAGTLDEASCRRTVMAMQGQLEQWVHAVDASA